MVIRLMVAAGLVVLIVSADEGLLLAQEKSEQTVIKPREFTIPMGRCPQLPADVEVKGLGIERTRSQVESVRGDRNEADEDEGRVLYRLSSRITGTATDNVGGSYTFSYQLQFRKPIPLPGSGILIDTFRLTGTGVADGLSTFFRGRVTLDSASNPIGLETLEDIGTAFLCDGL